jgi:hypothetical protein
MPEGWFVDAATGASITDPAKSAAGVLRPMGEYKGGGLALMIGLVAGVLNGAAFGRDVIDFNAADDSATNTGHCIVAVDIARFLPCRLSRPKSIGTCAICAARGFSRASTRSACRASAAPPAALSAPGRYSGSGAASYPSRQIGGGVADKAAARTVSRASDDLLPSAQSRLKSRTF